MSRFIIGKNNEPHQWQILLQGPTDEHRFAGLLMAMKILQQHHSREDAHDISNEIIKGLGGMGYILRLLRTKNPGQNDGDIQGLSVFQSVALSLLNLMAQNTQHVPSLIPFIHQLILFLKNPNTSYETWIDILKFFLQISAHPECLQTFEETDCVSIILKKLHTINETAGNLVDAVNKSLDENYLDTFEEKSVEKDDLTVCVDLSVSVINSTIETSEGSCLCESHLNAISNMYEQCQLYMKKASGDILIHWLDKSVSSAQKKRGFEDPLEWKQSSPFPLEGMLLNSSLCAMLCQGTFSTQIGIGLVQAFHPVAPEYIRDQAFLLVALLFKVLGHGWAQQQVTSSNTQSLSKGAMPIAFFLAQVISSEVKIIFDEFMGIVAITEAEKDVVHAVQNREAKEAKRLKRLLSVLPLCLGCLENMIFFLSGDLTNTGSPNHEVETETDEIEQYGPWAALGPEFLLGVKDFFDRVFSVSIEFISETFCLLCSEPESTKRQKLYIALMHTLHCLGLWVSQDPMTLKSKILEHLGSLVSLSQFSDRQVCADLHDTMPNIDALLCLLPWIEITLTMEPASINLSQLLGADVDLVLFNFLKAVATERQKSHLWNLCRASEILQEILKNESEIESQRYTQTAEQSVLDLIEIGLWANSFLSEEEPAQAGSWRLFFLRITSILIFMSKFCWSQDYGEEIILAETFLEVIDMTLHSLQCQERDTQAQSSQNALATTNLELELWQKCHIQIGKTRNSLSPKTPSQIFFVKLLQSFDRYMPLTG